MQLNAVVHGFSVWQPFWNEFFGRHSAWLNDRLAESDEIFSVPIADETTAFGCTFGFDTDDLAAERAFARLCRTFRIIGTRILDARKPQSTAQFISYEGLASVVVTDDRFLERGRELGWTDEQIANARVALRRADDMGERLVSAAGRLVCRPDFLTAREQLRALWDNLTPAERPQLPLRSIIHISREPPGARVRHLSEQASQFANAFEAFCEEWQVNGFETWNLPNPRGPQWPDLRASSSDPASGTLVLSTPWHYPVLDSDNLGRVAMEQHVADRLRHGIDDVRSWQLYGRLLRVDFWSRVLRGRYIQNERSPTFAGDLEGLLALILDVTSDHIKRLVRRHRELISGQLRSLAGVR